MTAPDPADTMIKQAARAITAALADAGLLADPADRDANTREAARIALEWRMMARKNEDRAERAEHCLACLL